MYLQYTHNHTHIYIYIISTYLPTYLSIYLSIHPYIKMQALNFCSTSQLVSQKNK